MFDLKEFVMKTLRGMAGEEPGYKVNRYALGWFERDVLTAEDLAEIDLLTTEPEATEEIPDETQSEALWEEGGTAEQTSSPQGESGSEACPDVPEAVEETQEGETQTTPEETPDDGETEETV